MKIINGIGIISAFLMLQSCSKYGYDHMTGEPIDLTEGPSYMAVLFIIVCVWFIAKLYYKRNNESYSGTNGNKTQVYNAGRKNSVRTEKVIFKVFEILMLSSESFVLNCNVDETNKSFCNDKERIDGDKIAFPFSGQIAKELLAVINVEDVEELKRMSKHGVVKISFKALTSAAANGSWFLSDPIIILPSSAVSVIQFKLEREKLEREKNEEPLLVLVCSQACVQVTRMQILKRL